MFNLIDTELNFIDVAHIMIIHRTRKCLYSMHNEQQKKNKLFQIVKFYSVSFFVRWVYRVPVALTTARFKQLNNVLDRLLAYATLIVIEYLDTIIIIVLYVRPSAVFTLYFEFVSCFFSAVRCSCLRDETEMNA